MNKRRLFWIFAVLAAAAAMLAFSEQSSALAAGALNTCAALVIPSLFPYMVISAMIISSGASDAIGRIAAPVTKILKIPSCGGAAFIMGALCGFPVGAICAARLYGGGKLTKGECERLIAVSNNTGPAFVISVIGAGFWSSRSFGVFLYAVQLLSSVAAVFLLFGFKKQDNKLQYCPTSNKNTSKAVGISASLTEAVTSSASGILAVCGYIVFFAVAVGLASDLLAKLHAPDSVRLIMASLTEFTAGSRYAALSGGKAGLAAAGFALGWSGLSVFFQSSTFTSPLGISLIPAVKCKLLQGVLCAVICAVAGGRFVQTSGGVPADGFNVAVNPGFTVAIFSIVIILSAIGIVKSLLLSRRT